MDILMLVRLWSNVTSQIVLRNLKFVVLVFLKSWPLIFKKYRPILWLSNFISIEVYVYMHNETYAGRIITALFTVVQNWKQRFPLTVKWRSKLLCIYIVEFNKTLNNELTLWDKMDKNFKYIKWKNLGAK